jgi:two-component sensor histidine kinase
VNQKARENELLRQSNIRLGNSNLVALITAGILLVTGICLVIAYRILRRKNRELQQQKSIIEQQSVEKDTLLREIHHRVKNNLQIVSGLLNLQAGTVDDPKARESLMLSQKRIKAISLIHQNLYGFDRLAHIRLTDYIKATVYRPAHAIQRR